MQQGQQETAAAVINLLSTNTCLLKPMVNTLCNGIPSKKKAIQVAHTQSKQEAPPCFLRKLSLEPVILLNLIQSPGHACMHHTLNIHAPVYMFIHNGQLVPSA